MAGGEGLTVRAAAAGDAGAIAAIYAHHVLHGTATFDTEAPDAAFWSARIQALTSQGSPFLVASDRGHVVGYAYAARFRDRAAYARTCENSIYVEADHRGRGIGTMLLEALIVAARRSGFREMIAVIGGGEPASVALHGRSGFRHAGRMERVGEKFGRLLDTVYMQRSLGGTV